MKDIHNYFLQKQLCENRFVRVFRAIDRESQKPFMLSIINAEYEINPKYLMRMISDRSKILAIHPHIASIVDYGEIESKQYFVSEYFGNKTLSSFLEKPVPVAFALDVISQLASGLHYLALQGYIHGNIRPDNIFFDSYGNAVLSAMELVLKRGGDLVDELPDAPVSREILAVSRYQSPEAVAGSLPDERSDLYSLGIILFELLTGERFSDRKYIMDTGVKNVNELTPYLPEDNFGFQPVINKLLAKNPKQRFKNGLELVDALNEYDPRLGDVSGIDFTLAFDENERADEKIKSSIEEKLSQSIEINAEQKIEKQTAEEEIKLTAYPEQEKIKFKIPELGLDSNFHLHSNFGDEYEDKFDATNTLNTRPLFTSRHQKPDRKYHIAAVVFILLILPSVFFLADYDKQEKSTIVFTDNKTIELDSLVLNAPVLTEGIEGSPKLTSSNSQFSTSQLLDEKTNIQMSVSDEALFVDSEASKTMMLTASITTGIESKKRSASIEASVKKSVTKGVTKSVEGSVPLITKVDVEEAKQTALMLSEKIESLLFQAESYISQLKFTTPKGSSAYDMYLAIQELDPENKQARDGIANIAEGYAYMANLQISKQNYEKAIRYIQKGLAIQENNEWLITLQSNVNEWLHVDEHKAPLGAGAEAVAFD